MSQYKFRECNLRTKVIDFCFTLNVPVINVKTAD